MLDKSCSLMCKSFSLLHSYIATYALLSTYQTIIVTFKAPNIVESNILGSNLV